MEAGSGLMSSSISCTTTTAYRSALPKSPTTGPSNARPEAAVLESERRFRHLVQGVTDYAIYMLDLDGFVANWNAGAERAKGYTAKEIVGQHFSRFYTAEDRATGLPARGLATALATGSFAAEGWRVKKDGSRIWANVVIDLIRDDAGTPIGFAKITKDQTEQWKVHAAALESEKRFRHLVQSVTDYAIYMLDLEGIVANWNAAHNAPKAIRNRKSSVSTSPVLYRGGQGPRGCRLLRSKWR